ncbi:TonB-dependent receptor [Sphingopyxis sp. XHP0097]|jgi:iron complex outermembrane receptor protein|uniref:TonB-dependent receptor n=1 Tax=Sphingopyxis jiangsuensis TaxID=2871171 RepID=A0ABS7MFV6_9SPHN|nr:MULTISPECIES: TonB-dependent receptor [Sphingopyxis]MBY4637839.1 TonB-dependent receptor [Sphingopyxis jiangsuensis]
MKYSNGLAPLQRRNLGLASLSAMAVILATPTYAQDTAATETSEEEAAASEPAIVVTGSRLSRVTPFNSPDPISVIDPEIASKEGKFDLASTLQSSPVAAGSTQITSAISSNFVTNGGPGAQTIDLRGLGANRTLVLLNGRRAGPAGTRGAVSSFDLNVLPQSIAQNVQILKTGASSVYGSDAVAGVVNIITKTDTDGVELNGNVSIPFDGGGEEYRLSAIWGKTFSRGHFLVAADYTKIRELARGDRSYLACPEAYTFREDGSRADLIDPRTGQFKCEDLRWGHVWTYDLIGNMALDGPGGPNTGIDTARFGGVNLIQFQYPGETLGIPTYGAPAFPGDIGVPAGWFPTGYDTASLAVQNAYHPFVEEQTIIPETSLITAYAEGAFEVSESVELFGEFLFNRRKTYQNGWRQFWNFGYTGDLYGTGTIYNVWAPGWEGVNLVSPTGITNHADSSQKVDYYRGVGGLRGDFGSDSKWRWEAYGQYSKSVGRYRTEQILQDVYDVGIDQGLYFGGSCVGTVLPVSGKQCIDLPWMDPYFLRGELTPEQTDFLFSWEEGKTVYTQLTGEATVNGDLIELPAGPLQVGLGVTVRRDRINDVPGEITLAANAWGASASGITAGKSITKEAFGEINVPVFADKPFFKDLSLSGAARITSVKATRASDGVSDSDNGNWTYKLGANWALNDIIRFRASYGTSFRAPALFEQFLANETSFPNARNIDPCVNWQQGLTDGSTTQRVADNCAADGIPGTYVGGNITATAFSQGGLGQLEAETSKALVLGGVLSPKFAFLPDTTFNVAVDYFNIRVKGEITQLGANNILFGCYDSDDFANEPLCNLFTRGQTADPLAVNEVYDQFVNIASQKNSGVDVQVNVRHDLGRAGRLNFTADMTWQVKDDFRLLPNSPLQSDNGEAGSPQWVGDFRLNWTKGGTSLFYGMNVIGGTSDVADFLARNGDDPCIDSATRGRYCPLLTTKATFYHNASITQEIGDGRFEITAGVSNIFNTRPPRVSVLNGGQITMLGPVVSASQYPFVGRRAFLNVRARY